MKKALTITIIFDGVALNRDESIGNYTASKKFYNAITKAYHTYISNYCLNANVKETLTQLYGWGKIKFNMENKNGKDNEKDKYSAVDPENSDPKMLTLFGYMNPKTQKSQKANLSNTGAFSLAPFDGNLHIHTNLYATSELTESKAKDIYYREYHKSFYVTTFSLNISGLEKSIIDLNKNVSVQEVVENVCAILYSGIQFHISGINYAIIPHAILAAVTKIPVPIFSRVDFTKSEDSIVNQIEKVINNPYSYIEKEGDKPIIYAENIFEPSFIPKGIISRSITDNYKEFVHKYVLED